MLQLLRHAGHPIYSDKRLDRNLFGWEMPVSWVQSINPVMIIVLAGAFATLWTKLAPRMFPTQMVALFFLSIGLGTAMSGKLAEYYNPTDETGFFTWIGLAAVLTGVAMPALTRPISRMMKGVR